MEAIKYKWRFMIEPKDPNQSRSFGFGCVAHGLFDDENILIEIHVGFLLFILYQKATT